MLNFIDLRNLKNIFKRRQKTISKKEQQNLRNQIHQRYRTNILFVFTLFTLTITLHFCWGIVHDPASNPEKVKSAFSLIVSIVSGVVGFVTGKAVS